MTLRREDLDGAVADGIVTRAQADALWERTGERALPPPAFAWGPAALLAAAGAAGAAALGAILLVAWEGAGPPAALATALGEAAALAAGARALARRSDRAAPYAAVLAALAVPLAAAAVRAGQDWAGVGPAAPPDSLGGWLAGPSFLPAAAAVAAALAALWALRAPLLSAVLVAALWAAGSTALPLVFGPAPTWEQHAMFWVLVGGVALAIGAALDGRLPRDHAGALYLAGLALCCGGITTLHADSGPSLAAGIAAYALLVLWGLLLDRRRFAVFGALGIASGLGRLADFALADPVVPFVFTALAAATVAAALLHERFAPAWRRALLGAAPGAVRRLLPPHAR